MRLRGDERSRILAGVETDAEEVGILHDHMDRAIEAAVIFVGSDRLVQVSISGDLTSEGVAERTTVAIDALPVSAPEARPVQSDTRRRLKAE